MPFVDAEKLDLSTEKMKQPWPDYSVEWSKPTDHKLLDELEIILNTADDERPLQRFYTKHPTLLAYMFPVHRCWVFPKPRLGNGAFIPDFLFCDRNSVGYQWTLIELESPRLKATTKRSSVSAACHHAEEQICDYRRWLRDHAMFEEKKYTGLNADCDAWIIIGRRDHSRTELERQRLADFHRRRIEIVSYDRCIQYARTHMGFVRSQHLAVAELISNRQKKVNKSPS